MRGSCASVTAINARPTGAASDGGATGEDGAMRKMGERRSVSIRPERLDAIGPIPDGSRPLVIRAGSRRSARTIEEPAPRVQVVGLEAGWFPDHLDGDGS